MSIFGAKEHWNWDVTGLFLPAWRQKKMRRELGEKLLIVTPGIRPGANVRDNSDDQKRIVTAGMAIRNGANHVVVGRPITRAADPIQVIEQMQQDIVSSLQ